MMNKHFNKKLFMAGTLATLMTACGGGGDGETDTTGSNGGGLWITSLSITDANMVDVAGLVMDTSTFTIDSASDTNDLLTTPLGVQTSTMQGNFSKIVNLTIESFLAQAQARESNSAILGVQATESENCTGGGNVSVTANLATNAGLSAGDVITLSFNQCTVDGDTTNGSLRMELNSYIGVVQPSGDFQGKFNVDTAYTNFSYRSGASTTTLSGGFNLDLNSLSLSDVVAKLESNLMTITGTQAGNNVSLKMSNVDMTLHSLLSRSHDEIVVSYDFEVTSPQLTGKGSVSTPSALVVPWHEFAATAGTLNVSGNNSRLEMDFNSDSSIYLQLDRDNNGSIDTTRTVDWDSLGLL